MALGAIVYNFDVELADADRHVYESLALRVARHPSESEEYMLARLLAYLLEFEKGIEFSRGVSDPTSLRLPSAILPARSRYGSMSGRPMPHACTRPQKWRSASSSTHTKNPCDS